MACRVIINGVEYQLPLESIRTAEDRIRATFENGLETILRVQISDSDESAELHLLPNCIATYAVFETR